jgi:phosphoglycerate dehydrogenase-like enzyme
VKVVVTDPVISGFAEQLSATKAAHELVLLPGADEPTIAAALSDADVVVCSRLTPAMTTDATRLRLVHVTGAGVDRLEPGSVPDGAAVCNTGHHGEAIAEHVLMTALMLRRGVLGADAGLRAGSWRTVMTAPDVPFHRLLSGDTIGIAGAGEIGGAVARLARAFSMDVAFLRRNASAPLPDGVDRATVFGDDDLSDFLAASDVLVVTVPLSDATRGMIGAVELAQLPSDAIVINVARGPLIDLDALADALGDGSLAGAAIDVWWDAPSGTDAPASVARLRDLPNTVLTPHFSGHAHEVFAARAADIARNIDLLAAGSPLERRVR